MTTKLGGGVGVNALVVGPIKKTFFAASLNYTKNCLSLIYDKKTFVCYDIDYLPWYYCLWFITWLSSHFFSSHFCMEAIDKSIEFYDFIILVYINKKIQKYYKFRFLSWLKGSIKQGYFDL